VNNAGSIGDVSAQASGTTGTAAADTTPPTVKITSPINGTSISSGNTVVKGTAQDNVGGSGVNTVAVSLDSGIFATATPSSPGNWSTWSIKVVIQGSNKGSHTLIAKATDKAGNIGTNQITITTK
jgi:hypothetical protein